jgi:hypothetical protein
MWQVSEEKSSGSKNPVEGGGGIKEIYAHKALIHNYDQNHAPRSSPWLAGLWHGFL